MEDLDKLILDLPRPIDCESDYCIKKVMAVDTLKPIVDSINSYLICNNHDSGNKITILSTFVSLRKCIECYAKYHETMDYAKSYRVIFDDLIKKTGYHVSVSSPGRQTTNG